MFNKFLMLLNELEDKIPTKKRVLYFVLSFIISVFFILPFVLLSVNLLYLYYELELLLVVILHILFILLVSILIKFYLSFVKSYELNNFKYRYTFYILGLMFSLIVTIFTFILYIILWR